MPGYIQQGNPFFPSKNGCVQWQDPPLKRGQALQARARSGRSRRVRFRLELVLRKTGAAAAGIH